MAKYKNFIPVNTPLITKSDAKAVYETISTGWISSEGPRVREFEIKMAKLVKRKFACCVSSGTAALEIAVKSLDIGKNDEVIMPTFTIISNANAIIKNLATPVLVDVDLNTWNIKIEDIENKISPRTKALMLPHIYGFPNDMDSIIKIVKKYKLYLIEDAAEMIGQKYKNRLCGSFGEMSIFSFDANKHITTGEGGMLLTNSKKLNNKIVGLRNLCFGSKNRFNHFDIGWNYRFTNIQASLGLNQLKRIKQIVQRKREIGNFYYNNLHQNKNIIIQPKELSYAKNIYWVFGVVVKKNNKITSKELQKKLLKKNIQTRSFFWPMHKQEIFLNKGLFKDLSFPNSEFLSLNGFYLPSGLKLKLKELKYITNIVNKYL